MRFNELIAGVRGDIAVKVFGDEFEPMLRAANQIAAILRGTKGADGRQGRAGDRAVRSWKSRSTRPPSPGAASACRRCRT